MFSLAFGIILSISKMARRKIAREAERAAPLVEHDLNDEIESRLDDLDVLDTGTDDQNNE